MLFLEIENQSLAIFSWHITQVIYSYIQYAYTHEPYTMYSDNTKQNLGASVPVTKPEEDDDEKLAPLLPLELTEEEKKETARELEERKKEEEIKQTKEHYLNVFRWWNVATLPPMQKSEMLLRMWMEYKEKVIIPSIPKLYELFQPPHPTHCLLTFISKNVANATVPKVLLTHGEAWALRKKDPVLVRMQAIPGEQVYHELCWTDYQVTGDYDCFRVNAAIETKAKNDSYSKGKPNEHPFQVKAAEALASLTAAGVKVPDTIARDPDAEFMHPTEENMKTHEIFELLGFPERPSAEVLDRLAPEGTRLVSKVIPSGMESTPADPNQYLSKSKTEKAATKNRDRLKKKAESKKRKDKEMQEELERLRKFEQLHAQNAAEQPT